MRRWAGGVVGGVLALLAPALIATACAETQLDWAALQLPSAGRTHIYGSYAGGCIAGAEVLPESGRGYQVMRLSRNRFWGHPQLIDVIERLGRQVDRAHLGTLAIGDVGQPRGGPMPFGHSSHQIGLDADIFFRLDLPKLAPAARETIDPVSVVDSTTWTLIPNLWRDQIGDVIRLTALDKHVERIFVNPVVKQALCARNWPDEGRAPFWLAKVRPWWGHDGHFHIRLKCPRGEKNCVGQTAPAADPGCGAELDYWLGELRKPVAKKEPEEPPKMRPMPLLPLECQNVRRARAAVDVSTHEWNE